MFGEAGPAIVAVNEAVHGFVRPVNLHLDEASLEAATLLALKNTLELVALLLDLLCLPVGALFIHAAQGLVFSFPFGLFARQLVRVKLQKLLWSHLSVNQEHLERFGILGIGKVENDRADLVAVGLASFVQSVKFVL